MVDLAPFIRQGTDVNYKVVAVLQSAQILTCMLQGSSPALQLCTSDVCDWCALWLASYCQELRLGWCRSQNK